MDSYDSTEFVAGIYRLGLDWMAASADAGSNSTESCCLEASNKNISSLYFVLLFIGK